MFNRIRKSVEAFFRPFPDTPNYGELRFTNIVGPFSSSGTPGIELNETLVNRSRQLLRVSGYYKNYLDNCQNFAIGSGIKLDTEIFGEFEDWVKENSRYHLSLRDNQLSWLEVLIRDGTGFLYTPSNGKIILLNASYLQLSEKDYGILFDDLGNPVSYRFQIPDSYYNVKIDRTISAEQVIQIWEPSEGRKIGVPKFASVLDDLYDFEVFLKNYNDSTDFLSQIPLTYTKQGVQGMDLGVKDDGTVQIKRAGVTALEPASKLEAPAVSGFFSGSDHTSRIETRLRHIAKAVGMSYHRFSGDVSKANMSSLQVVSLQDERLFMNYQTIIGNVTRELFNVFLVRNFKSLGYKNPDIVYPPIPSALKARDTQEMTAKLKAEVISPQEYIRSQGGDPEKVKAEIIEWRQSINASNASPDSDVI